MNFSGLIDAFLRIGLTFSGVQSRFSFVFLYLFSSTQLLGFGTLPWQVVFEYEQCSQIDIHFLWWEGRNDLWLCLEFCGAKEVERGCNG